MYNHNKAQQSKNRVHISWDILYDLHISLEVFHWIGAIILEVWGRKFGSS